MSSEQRMRAAIREYADAAPVSAGDLATVLRRAAGPDRKPGWRMSGWLVPVAAAASVLALVALVSALPARHDRATHPGSPPRVELSLPETVTVRDWPESLLTAPVTESPAGPASLLYLQGNGAGMPFSPAKYVAVSGDAYRRTMGPDPTAAKYPSRQLLSPDGTRVVYGDGDALVVTDLRDGTDTSYSTGSVFATPLAWSPDGQRIAYGGPEEYSGPPGKPYYPESGGVLELRTGRTTRNPEGVAPSAASFSPDSRRVAFQSTGRVYVIDRDRIIVVAHHLPDGTSLAGPNAWSPDGKQFVAVHRYADGSPRRLTVFDMSTGDPTSESFELPQLAPQSAPGPFLGWRTDDSLVYADRDVQGHTVLMTHALASGEERLLARFDDDPDSDETAVYDVQIAAELLPRLEPRTAGDPDFGPWPSWVWLTLAVPPLGLLLVVGVVWLRRRHRRATAPAPNADSPES